MTLDDLMIHPRNKPHAPSTNLATILHGPVISVEKVATAIMLDANLFMLVDAAGHAVWGMA
jgi:hypothetical protein